jgi:hypothetical protein
VPRACGLKYTVDKNLQQDNAATHMKKQNSLLELHMLYGKHDFKPLTTGYVCACGAYAYSVRPGRWHPVMGAWRHVLGGSDEHLGGLLQHYKDMIAHPKWYISGTGYKTGAELAYDQRKELASIQLYAAELAAEKEKNK